MNRSIVLHAEESFEPLTVVELPEKFIEHMAQLGCFRLPLFFEPEWVAPTEPPTYTKDLTIDVRVEMMMRKGNRHWIFTIPDDALQTEGRLQTGYLDSQKRDVVDRVWRGYNAGRIQGIKEALVAMGSKPCP